MFASRSRPFFVEMKSVVYAATAGSLTSRAIVLICRLRHQKLPSAQAQSRHTGFTSRGVWNLVWGYLRDGIAPELPKFEFAELPASQRFVSKISAMQLGSSSGGLDTAHFSYLHAAMSSGDKVSLMGKMGLNEPPSVARYRWLVEDGMPDFTVLKHNSGLVLGASRKADRDDLYWRITQFMTPNHSLAPNSFPGDMCQGNSWVPVDDHSCWIFCFAYHLERDLTDQERTIRERLGYCSG